MIIISSLAVIRQRFDIEYDNWRFWHRALAIVGILAAIGHITGVGYHMQDQWQRNFLIALVLSWVWLVSYMWIARPLKISRRPYVVESVTEERGDNWTINTPSRARIVFAGQSHGFVGTPLQ
jgi:3-phenylpropionate/trans-cinnamate dioxygenase ferredoxin reductase subunit